jgi:lysophospholipase L1-like esterase
MQVLEAIHISQAELNALLKDERTSEETLNRFYDLVQLSPFDYDYRLKSNVIITDGSDEEVIERGLFLDIANSISRKKKNKRYKEQLAAGKRRILAEGDSWFEHPHPSVDEILTHLGKYYAVYSLAAGGDVLRNMFARPDYLAAIETEKPEILLLSGGGNDILGSQFRGFLNAYTAGTAGENSARFINALFHSEINSLENIYTTICKKVLTDYPKLQIILHGYDYVIPLSVTNKGWLGRYMIEKNITDQVDKNALIKYILDIFNEMLTRVAAAFPDNVHYIDVRNTVPTNRWYDEIHPTSDGFQDIALKFMKVIDDIK